MFALPLLADRQASLYLDAQRGAAHFHVPEKKKNDEIVRIVRDLQHRFTVIDFSARDIDAALVENGGDIEEDDGEHLSSVQYVLARKQKCNVIITNNFKDYRLFFNIRVIKPERVRSISQEIIPPSCLPSSTYTLLRLTAGRRAAGEAREISTNSS